MTKEALLVEFADPIPSTLRLPGNGGSIEGEVTAVEMRPDGSPWIRVKIPTWERWTTQLRVGQKAVQGIGPAWTEVWAPPFAVETDVDRQPEITERVRLAKLGA